MGARGCGALKPFKLTCDPPDRLIGASFCRSAPVTVAVSIFVAKEHEALQLVELRERGYSVGERERRVDNEEAIL